MTTKALFIENCQAWLGDATVTEPYSTELLLEVCAGISSSAMHNHT
jgi:hypothetical protein